MTAIRFTWNEAKNLANQRKHGISFEVAAQVFADPLHLLIKDQPDYGEERWRALGQVGNMSVLVVAHTYTREGLAREAKEEVRIIFARLATRKERRAYEEH